MDTETTTLMVILLLTAVVTPLTSCLLRLPRPRASGTEGEGAGALTEEEEKALPPLSVVIPTHDNAHSLAANLPAILTQRYPAGFEVIIVDESSTDDTDDVLTRLKNAHDNLYVTFIPPTSQWVSRRKLAMTVGAKAARNEWMVFMDATCGIESDRWLTAMARHVTDGVDMVMGYTSLGAGAGALRRFRQMSATCMAFRQADRGTAYRCAGSTLLVRRQSFAGGGCFSNNLQYVRGEYDFMVNNMARKHNTATDISPEATARRRTDTAEWTAEQMTYMETRRHLARSFTYRLPHNISSAVLIAAYAVPAAGIALAAARHDMLLAAAAAAALVLCGTLRGVIAGRAARAFGERFNPIALPFLEIGALCSVAATMLRYSRSDKSEYIRR